MHYLNQCSSISKWKLLVKSGRREIETEPILGLTHALGCLYWSLITIKTQVNCCALATSSYLGAETSDLRPRPEMSKDSTKENSQLRQNFIYLRNIASTPDIPFFYKNSVVSGERASNEDAKSLSAQRAKWAYKYHARIDPKAEIDRLLPHDLLLIHRQLTYLCKCGRLAY
ncbi:hypothetical protein RF11_02917 [Thelohanellus kitauei]|uniref:Uncharacterized protein n=1 Tax=Thelohanellus kitauei TaxID=669202 RepID=A0A0C2JPU3_THEKT|nr:hypothetical protein RF11_02917 [Thelohanellus kitauei]